MGEPTYEELLDAWIRFTKADQASDEHKQLFWTFDVVFEMVRTEPDKAFQFVLDVFTRDQSPKIISALSAGTIEDLLAAHGPVVIERIEQQAKSDPKFAYMLGGVWQFTMSDDIWDRVQKVWDRRGWDGVPEGAVAKKALIISGGEAGHPPQKTAHFFARLLRSQNFEVEIATSLDALHDSERLHKPDLIIPNWTRGVLSEKCPKALLSAVESGVGCAGWHSGMGDAFRNDPDYQCMVGGHFVAHSGNIKKYTVAPVEGHPITKSLKPFEMNSELYSMHVDPSTHILATTTFEDTVMPVAWTRQYGKGRVFYCSIGNQPKDFDVLEARNLTLWGLLWAARVF